MAECSCRVRPCIHDRLPHLRRDSVYTASEKAHIREILEFWNPRPVAPEVRPTPEVRER